MPSEFRRVIISAPWYEVAVRLELVDQRNDETHVVERGRAAGHLCARAAPGVQTPSRPRLQRERSLLQKE